MMKEYEGRDGSFRAKGDRIQVVLTQWEDEITTVFARSMGDARTIREYWMQAGIVDDSLNDGQA